ncbi:endonuclease/exonuclease/phosphatase family protein [Nonomuraea glycinis]|uniref:endonuclease/exonuclease/phosphatase family protein n=1 Tax=Nonomuraea glycinis TaxID=2047744 RepID=UPI002E0EAD1B|nr:endonuclease/exonuclease/phosphatase family protein [Nonomuraea glycinis]
MTSPRHQAVLLALGIMILFDVLRVFLPSLITLFGRAGSTPAELMGLYAAAWFALPFLSVLLRPRWALLGGAVALVVARLLLQAGVEQLYVASAGVTAGLVFLHGCARTLPRAAVPGGIMSGLAFSTLAHLLLNGVDLIWRPGLLPWLATLTLCTSLLLLVRQPPAPPQALMPPASPQVHVPPASPQVRVPPADDLAPARVWFLFGPTLLLTGMATTSWAKAAQGPEPLIWVTGTAALLLLALVAATWQAFRPPLPRVLGTLAGVLLVCCTTVLLLPSVSPALGGSAQAAAGALAILCLGPTLAAAGRTPARPGRQGLGALGGGLVFLIAAFAYYAAYDMDLGFPQQFVPIATAVLVAAVAFLPRPSPRTDDQRPTNATPAEDSQPPTSTAPGESSQLSTSATLVEGDLPPTGFGEGGRRRGRVVLGAAVLLVPLVVAATWRPAPPVRATQGDTIKLIAYNIRMGFGLDGRLSLDDIAAWAAAQRPDVVLLSEVDRGWLLNGGHDDLARIARGLGMRYHFAPAADNVWGDALLTHLPVRQVHSHPLGRHDYPTGAQAQAIVLEVGGRELGIVNTHLQAPDGQAPEVAAIVRALAAGEDAARARPTPTAPGGPAQTPVSATSAGVVRPVVLAGDLNTRPGDPAMAVLEAAGLSDPLTALGDPPTSPADAPTERIDHVLISKGLTAISAQAPMIAYSDHLPVLTTLRLTSVDQEG